MVSAEGTMEDGKRPGRLWGKASEQRPLSHGEAQQTAAPSDAGVSDSAALVIDMLCYRNSWEKITWGGGGGILEPSLLRQDLNCKSKKKKKLVTEMFRAYFSQENIQILT